MQKNENTIFNENRFTCAKQNDISSATYPQTLLTFEKDWERKICKLIYFNVFKRVLSNEMLHLIYFTLLFIIKYYLHFKIYMYWFFPLKILSIYHSVREKFICFGDCYNMIIV